LLGADIEREFKPNTRIVFTESPGSLTFCVQDIPAIAAVAHSAGALVVTDNSWATPFGFRSFDHGVDVSVHAATKYIGGHSDVLLGLILGTKRPFPRCIESGRTWASPRRPTIVSSGCAGCARFRFVSRGTVESGLIVARWLQEQPQVREVIYPALPGSRGHELVEARLHRWIGSFRVRAPAGRQGAIDALLDGMRLFGMGWSWGGFESLLIPIIRSACRPPRNGTPADLACALQSDSRIRTT
jgi:cystathionine beta-lyase